MTYAFLALAYLLGATPTSYWVGKAFHGIDLRDIIRQRIVIYRIVVLGRDSRRSCLQRNVVSYFPRHIGGDSRFLVG